MAPLAAARAMGGEGESDGEVNSLRRRRNPLLPPHTTHDTPHAQGKEKKSNNELDAFAHATGCWIDPLSTSFFLRCCPKTHCLDVSLSMKFQASRFSASGRKCPSSPTEMEHAAHASPCMFSRLERDLSLVLLSLFVVPGVM